MTFRIRPNTYYELQECAEVTDTQKGEALRVP